MKTTKSTFLNRADMLKLVNRPIPFKASFHGSSVIIIDADGLHTFTGQVPAEQAEQIALSMTMFVQAFHSNQVNRLQFAISLRSITSGKQVYLECLCICGKDDYTCLREWYCKCGDKVLGESADAPEKAMANASLSLAARKCAGFTADDDLIVSYF